jgi:hypothetical protein
MSMPKTHTSQPVGIRELCTDDYSPTTPKAAVNKRLIQVSP